VKQEYTEIQKQSQSQLYQTSSGLYVHIDFFIVPIQFAASSSLVSVHKNIMNDAIRFTVLYMTV
jgi:hypothetical protein